MCRLIDTLAALKMSKFLGLPSLSATCPKNTEAAAASGSKVFVLYPKAVFIRAKVVLTIAIRL